MSVEYTRKNYISGPKIKATLSLDELDKAMTVQAIRSCNGLPPIHLSTVVKQMYPELYTPKKARKIN